jgi:hypothetical protein
LHHLHSDFLPTLYNYRLGPVPSLSFRKIFVFFIYYFPHYISKYRVKKMKVSFMFLSFGLIAGSVSAAGRDRVSIATPEIGGAGHRDGGMNASARRRRAAELFPAAAQKKDG